MGIVIENAMPTRAGNNVSDAEVLRSCAPKFGALVKEVADRRKNIGGKTYPMFSKVTGYLLNAADNTRVEINEVDEILEHPESIQRAGITRAVTHKDGSIEHKTTSKTGIRVEIDAVIGTGKDKGKSITFKKARYRKVCV